MNCRALVLPLVATLSVLAAPARAEVAAEIGIAELHVGPGSDHLVFESTLEAGRGLKHFALKVDGGSETRTAFDLIQAQALWMPQVSESTTLAFGVRRDIRGGDDLTHAAAGIEAAVMPWLDAEHYVFVSERGDLTGGGKLTASFDLADRLRVEPRFAVNWAAQTVPQEALGSGFTDLNASARLRYSVAEQADVYVGVVHERLLGGTAAIARADDGAVHVTRGVIGFGLTL